MAIDMTTVKAISYDNKDIVKIEDGQGNILWQKPSQDKYIYRVWGSRSVSLNTRTLEFKEFESGGTYDTGSPGFFWTDGTNTYLSHGTVTDSRYQKLVNFGNGTFTTSTHTWSDLTGNLYGYNVFAKGTDIYAGQSGVGSVKKFDPSTGTWTSATLSGTVTNYTSNDTFTFDGVTYCVLDNNHIKYLNNSNTWANKRNVSGSNLTRDGNKYWSPDGTHLFYTSASQNARLNTSTFDETIVYWSGGPTISDTIVNRMFTIGTDVYVTNDSGTKITNIYKLDLTTLDSATLVWTDVTSQFTFPEDGILLTTADWVSEDGLHTPRCGYGAVTFKILKGE